MPIVGVDQAAPGMVLANPVTDRRGRLLIPGGQEITEKHVNALKMWGVVSIDIEGDEVAEVSVAISPEALDAADQELKALYRHADLSHPFVGELFRYAVQKRAAEIEAQPESVAEAAVEAQPAPPAPSAAGVS